MYQVSENWISHEREFGEQVNAELVDLRYSVSKSMMFLIC